MRRRNEAAAPQQETKQSDPTAPPGAYDWTTRDAPPKQPSDLVEAAKTAMQFDLEGGPAAQGFGDGSTITVTLGKTVLFPEKFNGFEVGPLSITVALKAGERAADAWQRARAALEHLYQAELALRIDEFKEASVAARSAAAR